MFDGENGLPVERVLIFTEGGKSSILTDMDGKARLSEFPRDGILKFQHPSYESLVLVLDDLKPGTNRISLRRRVIQLSEFVVAANKWEQDRAEVPGRITSLGPREIRLQASQTAADALGSTGGVFIQKSQLGGGSPMIRGFAANALLIVVDGVRMNNAIFRSGNLQNVILIDPFLIDNAEVVYGPGSVMYGSDALGGVMDFHTIQPVFAYDSAYYVSGEAVIRHATANGEFSAHGHFNLGWKNLASLSSFTYSTFGHLRAGGSHPDKYENFGRRTWYQDYRNGRDTVIYNPDDREQVHSGYSQWNLAQRFRYRASKALEINYSLLWSQSSDIPRYDRLIEGTAEEPEVAEWYYGPQRWMMNQVVLTHRQAASVYDHLRVGISRQDMEESRHDRKFGDAMLKHRTEKVGAWTFNADAGKKVGSDLELFYGLDGLLNKVASSGEAENIFSGETVAIAPRYPDGGTNYYGYAGYAQLKQKLSQKLILHTGLRYSRAGLDAVISDNRWYNLPFDKISLDFGAFNGSLGLVWRPSARWQYNLSLSSGFRAPNLDDVGKVFDSEPGNVVVPNPGLKPEYVYNLESGVIFRLQESIRVEVDAFYSFVEDVMTRRDFSYNGLDSIVYDGEQSRVQALVNAGQARIWGISLEGFIKTGSSWSVSQQLSWTDGYEVEGRLPLRHAPPLFGRTTVSWTPSNLTALAYAEYNGWKRWDDLAPSEQSKPHLYTEDGTPAWVTLNIKASYLLTEHLNAGIGLENILDLHYRPYSSGISAPGRNLILSLRANF